MYKISTLNKISPAGLNSFNKKYTIIDNPHEAHGIMIRSAKIHDMEFSQNLLAIARAGAGVNNIPIDKCSSQGIVVFNTPGANANSVKEMVIASLIIASRNIFESMNWARTIHNNISKEVENGKGAFVGNEIQGKTLGVIGLGAIGVMVANTAHTLGMKVLGYDPYITLKSAHALNENIIVKQNLDDLLKVSDFITLHLPYMESTHEIIDEKQFDQMKDGAILLNFSRDRLVNEEGLLKHIKSGKISRYVSDFPNEVTKDYPNTLWIPHLGASTLEAEENCAIMAAEELADYLENGNITNSVNYPNCSMGPLDDEAQARICILNQNIPSMLGRITGLLAEKSINIRNLINKSKGDYACTLIDIDSDIEESEISALLDISGIIKIRILKK